MECETCVGAPKQHLPLGAESATVGTLFRGSEIHTSLLSSYAKTVAKKYLTKTLTSLIHNVCQLYDEGKSFEVDPARLKEGEVLAENADQLVTTTRSFLEKILRTVDECPAYLHPLPWCAVSCRVVIV